MPWQNGSDGCQFQTSDAVQAISEVCAEMANTPADPAILSAIRKEDVGRLRGVYPLGLLGHQQRQFEVIQPQSFVIQQIRICQEAHMLDGFLRFLGLLHCGRALVLLNWIEGHMTNLSDRLPVADPLPKLAVSCTHVP